jgi:hypothetical protein
MSTVSLHRQPAGTRITVASPAQTRKLDGREAVAATELMRWVVVLAIPFVLSAIFFGAAIATGMLWLMGVAFGVGPELMICGYIYLSITSDSNAPEAAGAAHENVPVRAAA